MKENDGHIQPIADCYWHGSHPPNYMHISARDIPLTRIGPTRFSFPKFQSRQNHLRDVPVSSSKICQSNLSKLDIVGKCETLNYHLTRVFFVCFIKVEGSRGVVNKAGAHTLGREREMNARVWDVDGRVDRRGEFWSNARQEPRTF